MTRLIRKHVRIIRRTVAPGLAASFWRKVRRCDSGCWIWRAARDRDGYGRIDREYRCFSAHRISYELNIGPIPSKLYVLHHCDIPACVNPDHLFLGTNADNMRDKALKGRVKCMAGEKGPGAKLSSKQVRAIRLSYADGVMTQRELATSYDIGQAQISRIILGDNWKNV